MYSKVVAVVSGYHLLTESVDKCRIHSITHPDKSRRIVPSIIPLYLALEACSMQNLVALWRPVHPPGVILGIRMPWFSNASG
jgi:hypothetical protein